MNADCARRLLNWAPESTAPELSRSGKGSEGQVSALQVNHGHCLLEPADQFTAELVIRQPVRSASPVAV